ncbi:DUF4238 domain-containing protein [Actinoallomurus sp. NPDC052274]|uniref:DUF4238 domain-containing protein n=1 Tax=Actinoallomurus sp. NPDC052274 TaxID=3155420 RepID=UPI0034328550
MHSDGAKTDVKPRSSSRYAARLTLGIYRFVRPSAYCSASGNWRCLVGNGSAGKKADHNVGKTRDHTVPQMYLRRFAEDRGREQPELTVRRIDHVDRPFPTGPKNILVERGFYWGSTLEGVPHHLVEELLMQFEDDAAPVMKAVLDAPEGALPESWPLAPVERMHLAWWMAAQILRTTRQRKRLTHASQGGKALEVPAGIAAIAANNPHLQYIVGHLAALALTLYARPWGLGFSGMCLLTSDVPVVLFNAQDADDQLAAAAFCDIVLPLDPHRLLLLPGIATQALDSRKRTDHRMVIQGAVGMALVQVVYDAADTFVVHHPLHDPWRYWKPSGPRLPSPWDGQNHPAPTYAIEYDILPPDLTVERRWLTEHPPPTTTS